MFAIVFEKLAAMFHSILLFLEKMLDDTPILLSIALAIFFASITFTIFYFIKENFFRLTRFNTGGIVLLEGVRKASKPLRIASNPNDLNYIEMPKSHNEKSGLEFSYNVWFVMNAPASDDKWSHMFHKGSPNSYPLRSPAVFIKSNKLRVQMNSIDAIENQVDISGIPIKKWTMLTLVLRGNVLDVFINGYLKGTINFGSKIPKLNDESLYVTQWGGFDGYMSDLRYFNYAITGVDIKNLFDENPSTNACSVGFDIPPYLDSNSMDQPE